MEEMNVDSAAGASGDAPRTPDDADQIPASTDAVPEVLAASDSTPAGDEMDFLGMMNAPKTASDFKAPDPMDVFMMPSEHSKPAKADDLDDLLGTPNGDNGKADEDPRDAPKKGSDLDLDALFSAPDDPAPAAEDEDGWGDMNDDDVMQAQLERAAEEAAAKAAEVKAKAEEEEAERARVEEDAAAAAAKAAEEEAAAAAEAAEEEAAKAAEEEAAAAAAKAAEEEAAKAAEEEAAKAAEEEAAAPPRSRLPRKRLQRLSRKRLPPPPR